MKQVPSIISTKDLSYLEDMFNWHFLICKKAYEYISLIEDEEIITFMKEVHKKHYKICESIIKRLGGNA